MRGEGIPGFSGRPSPRRSCGGRDAARTGSAWWLACARGGTGNVLPPRVGDARFILLEHAPNQSPQPALRQVLGQRINRHDPTQMDEILLRRLNDFGFRMVDRARPERYDLAVDQHFVTGAKVLFQERQVPPAAMEPRRAIVEDELED